MPIREKLSREYGITIADDSYFNPYTGKMVKQYRIYSADGCSWDMEDFVTILTESWEE